MEVIPKSVILSGEDYQKIISKISLLENKVEEANSKNATKGHLVDLCKSLYDEIADNERIASNPNIQGSNMYSFKNQILSEIIVKLKLIIEMPT